MWRDRSEKPARRRYRRVDRYKLRGEWRLASEDNDCPPFWKLSLVGAGYTLAGVVTLFLSRYVATPWRILVIGAGWLLVAAGGWCLLVFFGVETLILVSRTRYAKLIVVFVVVVLTAVVPLWIMLFWPP